MKNPRAGWPIAALAALMTACGCNGTDKPDDTGTPTPEGETLVFLDSNNYSFTFTLDLQSYEVKSLADIVVDWSAVDTDYRGRPLDPLSVDRVTLAAISLDHATLIDRINNNSLQQSDVGNYREAFPVAETSVPFTEFSILGDDFIPGTDFVEGVQTSWLLTLWKDNDRGISEILSSLFVVPLDASDAATVSFANDSAVLTFDADLTSAPPIVTVADGAPYALNWAAVTTDVNGVEFDSLYGDTLRIAHLDVTSVADAEAQLLKLDIAATETYYTGEAFSEVTVPDLSLAETVDGIPFPGFTTDGVWIVAIECTDLSCFSPAPLLLAVVEVQ